MICACDHCYYLFEAPELPEQCPDCGKQIHLFGQGKTAEAAERHHLPVLAEMPIDPALAALTDAGDIESFQGSWLEAAADKLEGK